MTEVLFLELVLEAPELFRNEQPEPQQSFRCEDALQDCLEDSIQILDLWG